MIRTARLKHAIKAAPKKKPFFEKGSDLLAVGLVLCETVSSNFPRNKEKYREIPETNSHLPTTNGQQPKPEPNFILTKPKFQNLEQGI